jgi:hypothetical protein
LALKPSDFCNDRVMAWTSCAGVLRFAVPDESAQYPQSPGYLSKVRRMNICWLPPAGAIRRLLPNW